MRRDTAVVLGGGLAGLLGARVLADHYGQVTIIDRDELVAAKARPRRGVPQGRHIHALVARGQQAIEELFPGISDELQERGVPRIDQLADARFYANGHRLRQARTGLVVLSASRPVLEEAVRERVLERPEVEVMSGHDIVGVSTNADRSRVTGALAISRADGSAEVDIPADLVVDASGRGSRATRWLEELGYGRVEEERVEVDLGYASAVYALPERPFGDDDAVIVAPSPAQPRGCAVARIEGGRWLVTLMGVLGDHPPVDHEGFLDFARTVRPSIVAERLAEGDVVQPPVAIHFPASTRRRVERLKRLPAGFGLVGDAVCSFNPIYGQGITVAALEALALGRHLERGGEPRALELAREIAGVADSPWQMAAGADLAFPGVPGHRPLPARLANRYLPRLHAVAEYDPVVSTAFVRVAGLVDPPETLMTPRIMGRVLLGPHRAALASSRRQEPTPSRTTAS